jgi:hypothetical protein
MSDWELEKQAIRDQACKEAGDGFAVFVRVFNHLGDGSKPYRYSESVQGRFLELMTELVGLVVNGEIQSNPKHKAYLLAQSAKCDSAVQELIRRASQRKPIR